jgi:hypothetical protein
MTCQTEVILPVRDVGMELNPCNLVSWRGLRGGAAGRGARNRNELAVSPL